MIIYQFDLVIANAVHHIFCLLSV